MSEPHKNRRTLTCQDCDKPREVYVRDPMKPQKRCHGCDLKTAPAYARWPSAKAEAQR